MELKEMTIEELEARKSAIVAELDVEGADLNALEAEIKSIKEEQTVLVHGVLACLMGLKEQGCNGPVTDAINAIEKHINKQAHK